MRFTTLVAVVVVLGGLGTGSVMAQSLSAVQTPAELPPASYRGAQYVDSQGCVFIRAGIDGRVTWVPRVNRQRQPICGQTPTLSGQQRTIARDPTPPAQVATPAPVRTTPTAQPTPRPAPQQVTTATRRTPQPQAAPVRTTRPVSPAARATPVRREPAKQAVTTTVSPATRVVPKHVHDAGDARQSFPVPKGYRPVWDDDRLNTRRAEQSLRGIARTRLIWTQTVPRRLVDTATGADMTSKVALVYPYTDTATQSRELGTVTLVHRNGQLQKRIVRNKAKTAKPATPAAKPVATKPTRSTTSRYVQVGTFGVAANAQAAAQRIQRAGLPASIGRVSRGGKSYQVVLAGPFANGEPLSRGLRTSRAAGFRDAFIRR
ncbi:MAG: SPOR domain-containing protein [Pseudomonadota bacterium]